jgi:hypothetical protein
LRRDGKAFLGVALNASPSEEIKRRVSLGCQREDIFWLVAVGKPEQNTLAPR